MSGKAAEKRLLRDWLAAGQTALVLDHLAGVSAKRAATLLLGLIAEADYYTRMQAVSALGQVAEGLAAADLNAGRELMRRLLWSLNEESGAVPWGAPEALGEIMARDRRLAEEFVNLLISLIWPQGNYLEFPPLQAGVAWGLGRLAQAWPALIAQRGATEHLTALLIAPEAQTRGCAAWALGFLADPAAAEALRGLLADDGPCRIFEDGHLDSTTVGVVVANALARLGP